MRCYISNKKLKYCKDCKFFTGVQCHGHGEFYGFCKKCKNVHDWSDVRYDDSLCTFYKGNIDELNRLKLAAEETKKNSTGSFFCDICNQLSSALDSFMQEID